MSETQAKKRKLDLKISRNTINAIHKNNTAIKDMQVFNQNQTIVSTKAKKSLSLKITKKDSELNKNSATNKAKRTITLPKSKTVADTEDAVGGQASELINKLDNLDNETFEINELPFEYTSLDNIYDVSTISEIQNIKASSFNNQNKITEISAPHNKRVIHNARRGKVKSSNKNDVSKTDGKKPFYIVVDTNIDYDEIDSTPSKKASELVDQNSSFFTSPSIFERADIDCQKVDLSSNYGSDYLVPDYSTSDSTETEFIGGKTDEDYFKAALIKEEKKSTIKNNYIVKSDDVPQDGKLDTNSNYVVINKVDTSVENTTDTSITQAAENIVSIPVEKKKKPFKSSFSNSIFKKFSYEGATGEATYGELAKYKNTDDNKVPNINYLELAENGDLPILGVESAGNVFNTIAPVQDEDTITEIDFSTIKTKPTIIENDYYQSFENLDEDDLLEDTTTLTPEEDDGAIEFDDEDNNDLIEAKIIDNNDINVEDVDTEDIDNIDTEDIDINDISLEDIDLSDVDLNGENLFNKLTVPEENDTTELNDLLSEVLQDSDFSDYGIEDEVTNNPSSFEEEKNTDSDFYRLIDSLSNTISDLENSITISENGQDELTREHKGNTGKAFNILINKDDIFSISIENETYDILSDLAGISIVSENINISTPKNNFFVKNGNKYIEIHRKDNSRFVVYTNFEDIEFENAINNITFTKKKNRIELNIRDSFKLSSVSNRVSLSILNTNLASTNNNVDSPAETDTEKNQNSVCDNKVLTINEETQKVYLPYEIEDVMNYIKNPNNDYHTIREVVDGEYTLSFSVFKNPVVSRFREAYNFMRVKEKSSIYAALDLALELMFNANLNPAIIRACKDLRELNVYLDCLYENELEKFDCFKIVYKVLPRVH
ncbi:MAG: hypothetical protein K6D97_06895 [Clostridia bacterium]|nr:hypothetical protein [Clostridia bacterium]